MNFIIVVLSLEAVAAAHLLHPFAPRSSLHPIANRFRPIGPIRPHNVLNSQNLHPSIGMLQPIGSQPLLMNANPMEDEQQAAEDFASFLTNKHDRLGSSLDLSSNPVQNNQLPYPIGYINQKYFNQPATLPSYYLNSGLPKVPIQDLSSPFGYLSAAREGDDVPVPKWTSFENTTGQFGAILRTNMINPESTNHGRSGDIWLNSRALYTLLIGVVLELMDEVAKGKNQYDEFFDSYLSNVLSLMEQPSVTPQNLASIIKDRMADIDVANSMLRNYIGFMNHSIYCNNSSECDKIIDDTLKTTTNKRLQDEAKILLAQVEMAEIFLSNYAAEFETHANNLSVTSYLSGDDNTNVKMKLKPLVLAGAELIKRRTEVSPAQPLDISIFPKSEM